MIRVPYRALAYDVLIEGVSQTSSYEDLVRKLKAKHPSL